MSIDDSKFENYLKTFRPVAAPKLAFKDSRRTSRGSRVWWAWAGATAVILIVAYFVAHRAPRRIYNGIALSNTTCCASPLSLRSANLGLFGAASTGEALDKMAFPPRLKLRSDQRSALNVLREERPVL
jgi:hypothetical protein